MVSKFLLYALIPVLSLYFSCLIEVEAQYPWQGLFEDEDDNSTTDEEFIRDFDEYGKAIICKAIIAPRDEVGLKLNLRRPMTLEDVTYLTFLNKARDFMSRPLAFPEDLKWRRKILNRIFEIFTYACPDQFVPHKYMNMMRELVMIYYNSIDFRTTNNTKVWDAFWETLTECKNDDKRVQYEFSSAGLKITGVHFTRHPDGEMKVGVNNPGGEGGRDISGKNDADNVDSEENKEGKSGGPPGEPVPMTLSIARQLETADSLPLDLIIDTLWMVFSHAWATCLPEQESKELWGPRFKQMFYREFLLPLEDRWKYQDTLLEELSFIAGDYDVPLIHTNLPLCTETAYAINGLDELQLVRPIRLADVSAGVARFQNRRLNG